MKRFILPLVGLLTIASLIYWWIRKPDVARQPHLVMVPPWVKISHQDAKKRILEWTQSEPEFAATPLSEKSFNTGQEVDVPESGGNGFVLNLTVPQALALKWRFRLDPRLADKLPHSELFVSLVQPYAVEDPEYFNAKGAGPTTSASWAADAVFSIANGTKLPVTQLQTPVLYILDTGIEPFKLVSGSNYSMSDQFSKVKLRQGRVANGLNKTWPPPSPAPWNGAVNQPLQLGATFQLWTPTSSYLNPQDDPDGHGTKVASAAVGLSVGVIGKLEKAAGVPPEVEVQSIRIYTDPPGTPSFTPTTSPTVVDGIYKAVAAHLARCGPNLDATAPSVLLLASRSTTGFDEGVEKALWWAWTKGMIVVASAGNEPGDPVNNELMHRPNAMWYQAGGGFPSTQSTTPARFDWTGDPSLWPNPPAGDGQPLPRPDHCYMILAGGNNLVFSSGSLGGDDNFRKSSTGAFQSSRGPDVHINAPSKSVPCAMPGTNGFGTVTGTSMAAGYVAGAALAYLACTPAVNAPPSSTVPVAFRDWLTPISGPGYGCKASTHATGWNSGPYRHSPYCDGTMDASYGGNVPKLEITSLPSAPPPP